ncbi:DUF742 domain-containing protein [Streptomyces sp. RFCAC02]|uniref:DUF742 domain-containing protein n=1 Tax=Streptomyces sp. RFCAC02 TaxID=2499143 RepID=UPI001F0FD95C|nr:DUF742 domain-containing protein [Streptomyces sp. RFCAC02]
MRRYNFPSAPSGSRRRPPAPDQQGENPRSEPRPRTRPEPPQPPQPPGYRPAPPEGSERRGPQDRGGPVHRDDRHRAAGAADTPAEWTPPGRQPSAGRRPPEPEPQQPLVRPYAMTGGRTRPRYQLAIEALVSTTADPVQLQGQLPEHQRICQLCYEVKSVAEVSALLSIPLGVARILVADLAEAGLVAIHQPGHGSDPGGQPDVTLLERVLSGLRKL